MMETSPYSPFKAVHHKDRLAAMINGGQPVPVQVHVVLSNQCQQNCRFCAYRREGHQSNELYAANPKATIPTAKWRELLADFADMGVRAVQFTGGGEPLTHPDHVAIFRQTRKLGLDLALVTNGCLAGAKTIDALSEAAWVRVSMDAATPENYARIRCVQPRQFERATAAIRALCKMRDKSPARPLIGIGFVVSSDNANEVYAAVKMASGLGVDNIRISAAFTPYGIEHHKPLFDGVRQQVREAGAEFDRPDFRVFDLYGDRVQDLFDKSPEYDFCPYMNLHTYVGADLNVYRCCVLAYTKTGIIGSIADRSFKELWQSAAKESQFNNFTAKSCPRCMFNNKNRFINYCLAAEPRHVNFI
jgi:MoaA/NifB/PqqE/SkfB family radical SAM enzyme